MTIIGITGKIGSGKTMLASHLTSQGYIEYGMADPLKKIGEIFGFTHRQLYGTQEEKLQKHPHWGISAREFLQKVGTDLFRKQLGLLIPDMKIKRTIWADLFALNYMKDPSVNYVISDVRFVDEASLIKELGGVMIRVKRGENAQQVGNEHKHASELEMDSIVVDYTIENNGTKQSALDRLDELISVQNVPSQQRDGGFSVE